ncbi:MFS transporter [Clostridium sp. D53t1_180928_C8]|uniref:MFS transporter n=1 Tax=Clostridium sp. D53t1_180928_C8 TaxID=2787101 RepID=UPI0018AA9614|nr:MFS transporter [Clostridium sp. D53t1_180928_C8]
MKNKNFIIIVMGQIISLFGNAIQRFSMSLYLLEFTGSTAAFSTILAVSTIPYIIFAPISGRLSDNVNRKKIMVYLDLICSVLIGGYAFILLRGHDHELIVGTVMFILSICATLYGPAVTSSIPQIVEEEKLTSANGIINQVGSIVNFAGPILAGLLYGILGIKIIVIINAISFLISAIMEMFLDIPDIVKKEESISDKNKKVISMDFVKKSCVDMKESFVYLKKEKKVILGIIASYALCNIFLVPILSIVAPYFINVFLGLPSQVFGIVEAICVLGMILGGLWISVKPNMFSIKKVHYTCLPMIFGIIIMSTLGFIKLNSYALAGIFAFGGFAIMLSIALSNVLTLTFIQKQIPSNMLGRVSAFSTAVATISVAPGQILFGQVIDIGIPIGIILLVSAIFNIGLMLFIKWNIRNVEVN